MLEQHGCAFHASAYVHLELKKCGGFLELEVDHVIGFRKALRSGLRNRELQATTESFCALDGVRARQSRKTADLVKTVTINQIWATYAWTPSCLPLVGTWHLRWGSLRYSPLLSYCIE